MKQELVVLDRDHPGFRDMGYRQRRNEIARLAFAHEPGAPYPVVDYSRSEREVWSTVFSHLRPLHARFACREFLSGWATLGFAPDAVPQFDDVNAILQRTSGFRLQPAAGLVTPDLFLKSLGEGIFFATQYLRHPVTPLYTPEPDLIHEFIGHTVLLAHPEFAAIHRLFGRAAQVADEETMEALIRVYWYTLEFGLAKEGEALRVVGAGLLSSAGEMRAAEHHPNLQPLDLEKVSQTEYEPTDFQPVLFVAPSTRDMLQELRSWLERRAYVSSH